MKKYFVTVKYLVENEYSTVVESDDKDYAIEIAIEQVIHSLDDIEPDFISYDVEEFTSESANGRQSVSEIDNSGSNPLSESKQMG